MGAEGTGRKGSEMVPWQQTQTPWSGDIGETTRRGSVPLLLCSGSNVSCSSPAPCYEGSISPRRVLAAQDCFHCTCLHPVGVGCCRRE